MERVFCYIWFSVETSNQGVNICLKNNYFSLEKLIISVCFARVQYRKMNRDLFLECAYVNYIYRRLSSFLDNVLSFFAFK